MERDEGWMMSDKSDGDVCQCSQQQGSRAKGKVEAKTLSEHQKQLECKAQQQTRLIHMLFTLGREA